MVSEFLRHMSPKAPSCLPSSFLLHFCLARLTVQPWRPKELNTLTNARLLSRQEKQENDKIINTPSIGLHITGSEMNIFLRSYSV